MTAINTAVDAGTTDLPARVLLVDDRPATLQAMLAVLEGQGYELVTAGSGEEALRRALQQDFAVIVMDVHMPGLNGFETAALIRRRERSRYTPIIFATATDADACHEYKGYAVGAVDYLMAPVAAPVLRAKVAAFVELFRKSAQINAQRARLDSLNRDLAERVRESERLNRELADANCELEAFSYTVSHDLRAPLRAIDGFSRILLEEYGAQLDEQAQHYLQRTRLAAERMRQLIEDLLQLGRVGRAELQRRTVDLSALAAAIARDLSQTQPARVAEFHIEPALSAQGDEQLLRIALENLLGNSWKYTGKQPAARIEFGRLPLTASSSEREVVFFVRDNGAGFDMAHAGELFTAFKRLHAASEFEGTGVGLATVQRVIQRHGGRVWAESAAGTGTTFYFTLSLEPVSVVGDQHSAFRTQEWQYDHESTTG
ncbi:MAG: response regulator [Deltaproteobacteria bacterium]|nr:response regulator [Deltaproteobacteria bacterium]